MGIETTVGYQQAQQYLNDKSPRSKESSYVIGSDKKAAHGFAVAVARANGNTETIEKADLQQLFNWSEIEATELDSVFYAKTADLGQRGELSLKDFEATLHMLDITDGETDNQFKQITPQQFNQALNRVIEDRKKTNQHTFNTDLNGPSISVTSGATSKKIDVNLALPDGFSDFGTIDGERTVTPFVAFEYDNIADYQQLVGGGIGGTLNIKGKTNFCTGASGKVTVGASKLLPYPNDSETNQYIKFNGSLSFGFANQNQLTFSYEDNDMLGSGRNHTYFYQGDVKKIGLTAEQKIWNGKIGKNTTAGVNAFYRYEEINMHHATENGDGSFSPFNTYLEQQQLGLEAHFAGKKYGEIRPSVSVVKYELDHPYRKTNGTGYELGITWRPPAVKSRH